MPEEMMLEDVAWESEAAEDWESDEALAETDYESAEDIAEDIGERARRRRRIRFRPIRGLGRLALRAPDGSRKVLPFPTKLATAQATNRGLARQEIARRALEKRVDRLAVQPKNESSVSGLVTLLIGGGLSAWAVVKASEAGITFAKWANVESAKMSALVSGAQLATTGAKLAINGRYHHSGFGIAADAFAAAQLAAFAFGRLYTPEEPRPTRAVADFNSLPAGPDFHYDYLVANSVLFRPRKTDANVIEWMRV